LNKWILTVDEDPITGDGILTFPTDLLEEAGWSEGDNIRWIDNKDGSWSLIKEEDLTNFIKKGIIKQ
jgi:bifunctional DNA-binding transcriptional regulator/antitoxin component of YhaV-PrlF toxin-antitoxin module